ncbi:MAG TPA: hypothetical protein VK777_09010 [Reyranella sp.]|jgi:hypothetical protein|nr:hypothetical protein [Reyranella sp.]
MESLDALLLMRMVERLLGLLAGGLCIVLGYRLFVKLPEKTDSSGKVVLPGGVSIWLSRVGPGIFFALFGAAIVAYSFTSTVKVTNEQNSPSPRVSTGTTAETPAASRQEIAAMSDRPTEQARREARQRQLMVLRGTLVDLNATIDRLGRDAASPERDRLVVGLQMAKMLLLRGAWDAAWGDPVRFQSWINSGAVPPAPAGMDEPAGLYLAGQTR